MAVKEELPFTLRSHPQRMNERDFHYTNPVNGLKGLIRARRLVKKDHGLRSAVPALDLRYGSVKVTIAATEPGHWVSSSGELPGRERQRFVIDQMAGKVIEKASS